jgi:hypothetical protein
LFTWRLRDVSSMPNDRPAPTVGTMRTVVGCIVLIATAALNDGVVFAQANNNNGYGAVEIAVPADNEILGLTTTLQVPRRPQKVGTLFVWPGLQPGGHNFLPIDNGVLQSVLTWGPSCAPGRQPGLYSTWWISAQYVNTFGHDDGYTGCKSGPMMPVRPGDHLKIKMFLRASTWRQDVFDVERNARTSFEIPLKGQAQNYAYFVIEPYDGVRPVPMVHFSRTTLIFARSGAQACALLRKGLEDVVSTPVVSSGGRRCWIRQIVLKPGPGTIMAAKPYWR